MRAVIYLRVSTDEQETNAQLDACTKYAVLNKLAIIGPFSDDGLGGATNLDKRPGLFDAIGSLGRGDVLLVARRDRLAREDFIRSTIVRMVEQKGAKVVSAAGEGNGDDPLDPTNYIHRSLADMMATYERLLIKARTRASLQAKIRRGLRVGEVRYGYDLAPDGKAVVSNAEEQAVIEQMREWRAAGAGYLKIAKRLSEHRIPTKTGKVAWLPRTVKQILNRKNVAEVAI